MAQASATGVGTVYTDYAPPSVPGLNDLAFNTVPFACHLLAIYNII